MDALKRIETLEKELAELKKQLEEEKSKKLARRFKPELGENYWYIDSEGVVQKDKLIDMIKSKILVDARYSVGNCFRSWEEADFEVQRLKVIAEMKEFAEPEDATWKNKDDHWYINYWHDNYMEKGNTHLISYSHYDKQGPHIYFDSYEAAEECAKIVGEERIQKYYLRVKED